MANKLTIGLGLFMVLFASSMQDPMSNAVFALQIGLLMAGMGLAVYGARRG